MPPPDPPDDEEDDQFELSEEDCEELMEGTPDPDAPPSEVDKDIPF